MTDIDTLDSGPENNDHDEEYSPWGKKETEKFGANMLKKSDGIPFFKFGIGFLILVILLMLLFSRSRNATLENRIIDLENRLTKIDQNFAKFEAINDKVTQIWDQAQSFEQFKDRFDRSEASMMLRMDHIVKSIDRLQKQRVGTRTMKAKSSKTTKISKKTTGHRYHMVKTGETLYKISRQYGVTVEKLRQLNKLAAGTAIHPGQKLQVSP